MSDSTHVSQSGQWSDIHVDGIPMGAGYGIELDRPPRRLADLHVRAGLEVVPSPPLAHIWLTEADGLGVYRRVREISPTAVVSARRGDQRIVFDQRSCL